MKILSKILAFLNFGFLKRVDSYLLENHPLIWRTGIHYFLFYSAIVGNLLAYLLGQLYPIYITNFPSVASFNGNVSYIQLILLLLLTFWIIVQFRKPLSERKFKDYVLTALLYTVCLTSIYTNTNVFAQIVVQKIAEVMPDAEFEEEYAFHSAHDFWECTEEARTALENPEFKRRIENLLRRFGLAFFSLQQPYNFEDYYPNLYGCGQGEYGLLLKNNSRSYPIPLKERLTTLSQAKAFKKNSGIFYTRYVSSQVGWMLLFFLISMLITFIQVPRYFKNYINKNRLAASFNPLVHSFSAKARKNETLMEEKPLLWSTNIQSHFKIVLLINFLLIFGLILLPPFHFLGIIDINFVQRLNLLDDSLVGLIFLVLIPGIYFFNWLKIQSRIPFRALNFREHYSISLLFQSIGCVTLIFIIVFIIIDNYTYNFLFFSPDGEIVEDGVIFIILLLFGIPCGFFFSAWAYLLKYSKQIKLLLLSFICLVPFTISIEYWSNNVEIGINTALQIVVVLHFFIYILINVYLLLRKTSKPILVSTFLILYYSQFIGHILWTVLILLRDSGIFDRLGDTIIYLFFTSLFLFFISPLITWLPMKNIMEYAASPKRR